MSELKTEISDFEKDIELIMSGEKGLSYSSIKAFLESPKHFYEYKTCKETTPAMEEGKMFHMACLELDKFKEKYWILDDSEICQKLIDDGAKNPRGTKDYKKWVAEQDELNKGRERISKEDFDTYIKMSESLYKNKSTKILMDNLVSKEEDFEIIIDGFLIKGKIDGRGEISKDKFYENALDITVGIKYQIDLKKVANASYEKIKWDIRRMKYHLQGGLYSNANNIIPYFLIYIDKACNITVVKLDENVLNEGFICLENALVEFTRCAEEDSWHSSYEFHNGGYIIFS